MASRSGYSTEGPGELGHGDGRISRRPRRTRGLTECNGKKGMAADVQPPNLPLPDARRGDGTPQTNRLCIDYYCFARTFVARGINLANLPLHVLVKDLSTPGSWRVGRSASDRHELG